MEIIIENDKIQNLEELMKDSKWDDSPNPDGPFLCFSSRDAFGEVDGELCIVTELHNCMATDRLSDRLPQIIYFQNDTTGEKFNYEIELPYRRDPHTKTTKEFLMKNADYRKHNNHSQNSSTYHKKDGTPVRGILKRETQEEIKEAINPTPRANRRKNA